MHIFLKIGDNHTYTPHEFKGNYALELMILTVVERYFGREIRLKVESLLKSKIAEEELKKNVEEMREKQFKGNRI